MTFYGVGNISSIKETRGKSPYFLVTIQEQTETKLTLKVPYTYKKLIVIDERVFFEGFMNEDGVVEANEIKRAYLELLGFNFVSKREEVFSFTNKGLFLKVDVKAPRYNLTYKTFEFLAKASSVEVLDRLLGVLKETRISLKGIFKNNVGMITSIEKTL